MSETTSSPLIALLDQARHGDARARDELFEKSRNYVRILARVHLENWLQKKVDASDLVQQTLLEAHQGFPEFQGETEAEWLGWLKRILRHNTADLVRHYRGTEKRQITREVPLVQQGDSPSEWYSREPACGDESPSQAILRKEREIQVADAVSQLPQDYQDVILLRNMQRLPFEEIADRMGRSRPAVQMLWMRALRKLREVMEALETP